MKKYFHDENNIALVTDKNSRFFVTTVCGANRDTNCYFPACELKLQEVCALKISNIDIITAPSSGVPFNCLLRSETTKLSESSIRRGNDVLFYRLEFFRESIFSSFSLPFGGSLFERKSSWAVFWKIVAAFILFLRLFCKLRYLVKKVMKKCKTFMQKGVKLDPKEIIPYGKGSFVYKYMPFFYSLILSRMVVTLFRLSSPFC